MKFKLFGIIFKIEYLFFVVISLALFSNNKNILYVILFSSLHELGHIISLYLLGGKVDELSISYYGIGLKHSSYLTIPKEIIFLSSGVLVNLLFIILGVYRNINLGLFIINALPIYPLDMGRIIKLITVRFLPYDISDKIYYFISCFFFIAFVIYAVSNRNYNYIIISAYLLIWLFRGYYD